MCYEMTFILVMSKKGWASELDILRRGQESARPGLICFEYWYSIYWYWYHKTFCSRSFKILTRSLVAEIRSLNNWLKSYFLKLKLWTENRVHFFNHTAFYFKNFYNQNCLINLEIICQSHNHFTQHLPI